MRDNRDRDSRLRDSLPNLVARLFRQVARIHNRELKPLGLSAVQAHLLVALWLEGAMTIGELQQIMALQSSSLTGALDRMEKLELIRRTAVEGDRRAIRIEPTDFGDEKRARVYRILKETEVACFAGLTATERRQLSRLLNKATMTIEQVDHG